MDALAIGVPICAHLPGRDRFVLSTLLRLPSVQALALHSIDSSSIVRASARGLADLLRLRFHHATVTLGSISPPETLLWTLQCHDVPTPARGTKRLEFWIWSEEPDEAISSASKEGHVDVLQCWLELGQCLMDMASVAGDCVDIAAAFGRLEVLEWWRGSGIPVDWARSGVVASASENGDLLILDWWKGHGLALGDANAGINSAAKRGHLHVLEWWRTSGYPVDWTDGTALAHATEKGHLSVLEWWKSQDLPLPQNPWRQIDAAAGSGSVQVLEFWRTAKPHFAAHCNSYDAVQKGHVEVLEWLKTCGYPISPSSPETATLNDQAAVLEWLQNSGLPMDWDMERLGAIAKRCPQAARWLHSNKGLKVAVSQDELLRALSKGDTWLLDFAMQSEPQRIWRDDWLGHAAATGQLAVFEWRLKRTQKPFKSAPQSVLFKASRYGHLEILQWMRDHNVSMRCSEAVVHAGCKGRSTSVLQWWKEEYGATFKFDAAIVLRKSIYDRDMLEWWKQSGYGIDWPPSVSMYRLCWEATRLGAALVAGIADVLQWWSDNGAELDDVDEAIAYLLREENLLALEWARISEMMSQPEEVDGDADLIRWWTEFKEPAL
ncbi:hypothetical protein DFJ73DRAFT_863172 [Zopfochytrium polystomum]|nr:hypothetical protein DFJ73DRAFT_863172 [Zopfochytrium polystomum]